MDGWKHLKNVIDRNYGRSILKRIFKLELEERKRIKAKNHIIFLKRCKKNQLVPKRFTIKNIWQKSKKNEDILNRTASTLLKNTISFHFKNLKQLDQSITSSYEFLSTLLCTDDFHRVKGLIDTEKLETDNNIKETHKKKFENLLKKHRQKNISAQNTNCKPNCVINLSSQTLEPEETQLLELGLNYAVPLKPTQNLLIEAAINIEKCIFELDDEKYNESIKNDLRFGAANILKSDVNSQVKQCRSLHKWIRSQMQSLTSKNNIVVCPADKGNATVIMNRTDYEDKIKTLLSNPTYQMASRDPTKDIDTAVKTLCMNLMKMKRLDKETYQYITSSNSRTPRFYGLPKIHKENSPLRPIVDFRHSPTYKLAKLLKTILTPVLNNEFTIKNSYRMSQQLQRITVPAEHEMVSFDVVSLFTNVPVQDTLDYVSTKLKESNRWKDYTKLTRHEIMKLLKLCVDSNYFEWKGNIYTQTDGCPMGSPISPLLAEFALEKLENKIIKNNSNLFFYRRYVDDSFAIIRSDEIDKTLEQLNNFHPSLKFTCEKEDDRRIAFLDLEVRRDIFGTLHKRVYRKPTHTGRYLNFNSYHHISQKMSVVDSLAFRGLMLCDNESIEDELEHIISSLQQNDYPIWFIKKRIEKMKEKVASYSSQRVDNPDEKKPPRLILPFMGPLTTRITNYFRNKLSCEFGYIPGTKIGNYVCSHKEKRKDAPPGIYKIPCSCKQLYIGESGRPLKKRVDEHFRKNANSAIKLHQLENPNHYISPDSASLVEFEARPFHRRMKESLFITKTTPFVINREKGTPVNPFWSTLLLPMLPRIN